MAEIDLTIHHKGSEIEKGVWEGGKSEYKEMKNLGRTDSVYKGIRTMDTEIFKGLLPELLNNIEKGNVHTDK